MRTLLLLLYSAWWLECLGTGQSAPASAFSVSIDQWPVLDSALHYQNAQRLDTAQQLFRSFFDQFERHGNAPSLDTHQKNTLAHAYYQYARMRMQQSEYLSAIEIYRKSVHWAKLCSSDSTLARAYMGMGAVFSLMGNSQLAAEYFQQATTHARAVDNPEFLSFVYSNMAHSFFLRKQYAQGIGLVRLATDIQERQQSWYALVVSYNNIGYSYLQIGRLDSAEVFLQKALALQPQHGNLYTQSLVHNTLAELQIARGQLSKARQTLQISQQACIDRADSMAMAFVMLLQAEIELKQKAYPSAAQLASQALAITTRYPVPSQREAALKMLFEIYRRQQLWPQAYTYAVLHQAALDSLWQTDNRRKLFELSAAFEYEQLELQQKNKQAEIELERTKNRNQRMEVALGIGMAVLALIAFSLAGKLWRGRLRTARELKTKNLALREGKAKISNQVQLLMELATARQKQNLEIANQRDDLERKRSQILNKTYLMEHQQAELIDSLTYARRIQNALMEPLRGHTHPLVADAWVGRLGDVLASSFVWRWLFNDRMVYVLVDSTSPGIQNALACLLVYTNIDNWMQRANRLRADRVLDYLHQKINDVATPEQSGGLQLSVFVFKPQSGEIDFAGKHTFVVADSLLAEPLRYWADGPLFELRSTHVCYFLSVALARHLFDGEPHAGQNFFQHWMRMGADQQKKHLEAYLAQVPHGASSDYFLLSVGLA